jgi:hypothetical protein
MLGHNVVKHRPPRGNAVPIAIREYMLEGATTMTDRDRTQADIEARLVGLGQVLTTLRLKAGQQQEKFAVPLRATLDAIESKRGEVENRLEELEDLDDNSWSAAVAKLISHLDDIDAGLRKALAHFG